VKTVETVRGHATSLRLEASAVRKLLGTHYLPNGTFRGDDKDQPGPAAIRALKSERVVGPR